MANNTELQNKAHAIYFDKEIKEKEAQLSEILELVKKYCIETGCEGTVEEHLRLHGCPEYGILSKRVFLLSDYNDSNWALENLNEEDLKEWSGEQGLDVQTMLAIQASAQQKSDELQSSNKQVADEQSTTPYNRIKEKALRIQAMEDIRQELYNEWVELDEIAKEWRDCNIKNSFIEFAIRQFIQKKKAEYEANYDNINWSMYNLTRQTLRDWCIEHDYDFFSVCRVLDDKDIFI